MVGLKETLSEIFRYLRQYRSRTAMTMFGLVWGTVTIIVLLAFSVGVKRSMSKNMHGMGEGVTIIWPDEGGRWIDDLDIKDRKRVVFLGNKLKEYLFGKEKSAIGEYVFIGNSPFLVVGVLKKKTQNSSYSSQDQDRAFIPATTFAAYFGSKYIENMVIKVFDPRQEKAVERRIYEILGKKYQFDPDDKQALGIWDTTEMDKFVFYFSLGFNVFMGIIGVFTLTVGGIGLANIMYVVVQERTREIGIRRSVGAKRSHIMGQFILETFIIIGLSGILGFLISVVLVKAISLMPIEDYVGHPVMSPLVAIVSIVVLGLIGFFAGYFPARRAARIEVADAMRA